MRLVSKATVLVLATVGLVSAAAAEQKKAEAKDPNRMICQKQEVLGSRVATKRVCMTAAEWELRKLEDRQAIDKAQAQPRGPNGG